jgi:hypothetical protein
MSRTSCVQTMRTAAHKLRTNYAHCRARSAALPSRNAFAMSRTNCVHCRARSAALPSCSLCAMSRTTCCPMQRLKPYNRMQMQLTSIPALSQPPLAAMPQLSEKPHLGFATKKTAWNPGPNVCNFTVTLGLQVVVVENGVRKTYSARYYNPANGTVYVQRPMEGILIRCQDTAQISLCGQQSRKLR